VTGRIAWSVVDLGFGDAGKGQTVDELVRAHGVPLVVRFNGGAQAGHNVIAPDGRHHCFSQFGAGTFVPGCRTLLSADVLVHPLGMLVEAEHLAAVGVPDALARVGVHRSARVITPYQQATNHARERARGDAAHGTCGVGVGECVADSLAHDDTIRVGDLADPSRIRWLLGEQRDRKRAEVEALGQPLDLFDDPALIDRVVDAWRGWCAAVESLSEAAWRARLDAVPRVVFEGAQGVLLDEGYGFHPHTTWSDCTGRNICELWDGSRIRLGVTRSYQCRHGAGPLPTEGEVPGATEPHNGDGGWQGRFRVGPLDGMLLRYALEAMGGVDRIVVRHLDQVSSGRVAIAYDGLDARFLVDGRLRVGVREDLVWQEALGQALLDARPRFADVPDIAAWVQEWTDLPVVPAGR
jgi:adenylosuccinate synthase